VSKELTIIKVGTGVLTREEDGRLDGASLVRLVTAVAELTLQGHRCLMVSSGAVGAGISALGLKSYPNDVHTRQACAAIGQTRLMHAYENLFRNFELSVAQLLLTADDLSSERRSGRVKDTLAKLLEQEDIIPIINENDSVAVEELRFGDNDMLSARVAVLVGAKRLVLLTSVDGLMHPESGDVIPAVSDVEEVFSFAREDNGRFSIGGMKSKLQAVKFAVDHGAETLIANGRKPENLVDLVAGNINSQGVCTRFSIS